MNNMVNPQGTETSFDWADFFNNLEKQGKVPYPSSEIIDRSQAMFQSMYLDLAQIKNKIEKSGLEPPVVTIYADVLNIPSNLNWVLNRAAIVILARQILVGDSVRIDLDFRQSKTASLVLFTNELAGQIVSVAVTDKQSGDAPREFQLESTPPKGGVQICYKNNKPTKIDLSRAQGLPMTPTETFQSALRTEFIFASLLWDQNPPLALSMMTWLKDWSGVSQELLDMFLRSSSLLSLLSSQINAQKNGSTFVPYLTQEVYTDLASAFVNEAKQYESDYMELNTQKVLTDQGITLAKTLLDNKTYESQYINKLLEQAKANYDNAVEAVNAADKNFSDAQTKVKMAQIDFKDKGVPEWKRKKIVDAIISLATAGIEFAVGIGLMLVGDEAGGAGSAQAAIEGGEAVAKAAKTGTEIAKMAKNLTNTMKTLKKLVDALQKVYKFLQQTMLAAQNIQDASKYAKKMNDMDVTTDGADITSAYQWQIFRNDMDAVLQDPIDKKVGYAKELKLAVDDLAVYGQALAAAQVAVIQAGQSYATILLQQELAKLQQKRLQQYVNSLKAGEAPIIAMMQQFYLRYVDAKSSLFSALENYRASYFYWSLEHSTIKPMIIDPVNKLETGLKDLTAIALDKENALKHFSPPPQNMKSKQFTINDETILNNLKKKHQATWNIALDNSTFIGLDRVRLKTVRIWLNGIKGQSGTINVAIKTTGSYQDRFKGKKYQFTAKPLYRGFEYRITNTKTGTPDWEFPNGTFAYIEIDGSVDNEVSYAYFVPTPFAEWQINISNISGELKLGDITEIIMEFAGSAID